MRATSAADVSAGVVIIDWTAVVRARVQGIGNAGEVGRAWLGVELAEQCVTPRVLLAPANLAAWIVDVAKNDCPSWAGLLTSRHHIAVANWPFVHSRRNTRCTDPLHTIGAFLDHASPACSDVRIMDLVRSLGRPLVIVEPIETPNFVGAVVRACPRADTPAVDHLIEPFAGVHRRVHRANNFTRRFFAMHAKHGLEERLGLVCASSVVSVDAQPVHLASTGDLFRPDDRHIVFGLAGDNACIATEAEIEIDRHAPGISIINVAWIDRGASRLRSFGRLPGSNHLDDIASFHSVMMLGSDQLFAAAGSL